MDKKISFRDLLSRLGTHIFYQMVLTIGTGIVALDTSKWQHIVAFICLVLGNMVSVITAFIDKSSGEYGEPWFADKTSSTATDEAKGGG